MIPKKEKNYKTLLKEIKEDTNFLKPHVHGLEELYCLNIHAAQSHLQIQRNSHQNINYSSEKQKKQS